MTNHQQQNLYDTAIRLLVEAEAVMIGVNDPELWREVYRATGTAQCDLDGEDLSPIFDLLGVEPEVLPDSQPAKAIGLVLEAVEAIKDLQELRLRVMALARLQMANILFVSGGDLTMELW